MLLRRLACIGFLWLSLSSIVFGQGTTASISGKVTNESGAVVPGVSVTLTDLDTGVSRTAIIDDSGRYRAPELELGNYEVKAELAGFQTSIRSGS
ncbi:MAG: carboxypeptidase regulatory-like domain-containing protein [Acidobacteria bacterium]|nr:carboxypeptidase regulatory-like domain-containing protein [Acidobacteriota bacterium]